MSATPYLFWPWFEQDGRACPRGRALPPTPYLHDKVMEVLKALPTFAQLSTGRRSKHDKQARLPLLSVPDAGPRPAGNNSQRLPLSSGSPAAGPGRRVAWSSGDMPGHPTTPRRPRRRRGCWTTGCGACPVRLSRPPAAPCRSGRGPAAGRPLRAPQGPTASATAIRGDRAGWVKAAPAATDAPRRRPGRHQRHLERQQGDRDGRRCAAPETGRGGRGARNGAAAISAKASGQQRRRPAAHGTTRSGAGPGGRPAPRGRAPRLG